MVSNTSSLDLKKPKGRELLGGDLLAQSLYALGVRIAFGLHGGHLDAFLYGCESIGIRLIDTRHETVAVQAAEGYAKVSGNVGTCFVTANSGFCNGFPGLATAFADRSPIFCVTSSPPLRDAETNSLQGFHDQVVLARPVTKFAHRVTNVEEIPRLVSHAFRTAIAGAPGPVLMDFPIDVLFSPVDRIDKISWGALNRPLPFLPGPSVHAIQEALKFWKAAERPVIIASTGAHGLETEKHLLKLAETTRTPVFSSMKYNGVLPFEHPLRGGLAANLAILKPTGQKQPDLIIFLGVRTGFLLGGRSGGLIPNSDCRFIQVDVDGSEIGRTHPIDVGIVSGVTQALATFNLEIEKSPFHASEEWVKTATSLKTMRSECEDESTEVRGKMHPYHAVKKVFTALKPGAIICTDGGEAGGWCAQHLERAHPFLSMNTTGYLGFLGNGWGYSLGAAIADPSRQIVNMQGDGSAGFHIAELDTYARFNLNILTVIVNNYSWGMSQNGQELVFGEDAPRPASKLSASARYEVVADGFGCASARADKIDEIEPAIKKLSETEGPGCLNMIVSDHPIHMSTRSMVHNTKDPNVIVVPYYDNLPRPYYKE